MIDLVEKLDCVRQTGPSRWRARCPAHEGRSQSLAVSQTDNGTWLVHCFAGCEPLGICSALGIEFADLFPGHRIQRVTDKPRVSARDVLNIIEHEVTVITVIAADFLKFKTLDEQTWSRLARSVSLISRARDNCR